MGVKEYSLCMRKGAPALHFIPPSPLLPMTLGIGEGETRSEGTKTKMGSTLYYRQYKQFNSRAPAVLAHTLVRQLVIFP